MLFFILWACSGDSEETDTDTTTTWVDPYTYNTPDPTYPSPVTGDTADSATTTEEPPTMVTTPPLPVTEDLLTNIMDLNLGLIPEDELVVVQGRVIGSNADVAYLAQGDTQQPLQSIRTFLDEFVPRAPGSLLQVQGVFTREFGAAQVNADITNGAVQSLGNMDELAPVTPALDDLASWENSLVMYTDVVVTDPNAGFEKVHVLIGDVPVVLDTELEDYDVRTLLAPGDRLTVTGILHIDFFAWSISPIEADGVTIDAQDTAGTGTGGTGFQGMTGGTGGRTSPTSATGGTGSSTTGGTGSHTSTADTAM